jgi:hypothetical protein
MFCHAIHPVFSPLARIIGSRNTQKFARAFRELLPLAACPKTEQDDRQRSCRWHIGGGRSFEVWPMKRGLQQRLARIETEARTLARSGDYRGFDSIEMILLARGYQEAHKVFSNRWSQAEVDRLCRQARKSAA